MLLVEDEFLVRMVAKEMFQGDGFEVLEAETGDEAIRMLDDLDYVDIVVTDVRMPGRLDGVDVAQHARTRFPQVPVIVVTGFAANVRERLKQSHPSATLVEKPYRLEHLAALAQTLSGVRSR